MLYINFLFFFFFFLIVFLLDSLKSFILIVSTGALFATFFSDSKVLDFLAIKVSFYLISLIWIYGSSKSNSNSEKILFDITELLKLG